MASNTIVLFGAGATRACGGPLTNEILPQAFDPSVRNEIEREDYIDLLDNFLIENFYLPPQQADRTEADYPALPLLLSLVDTAIDRNQPMGPHWTVDRLRQVRRALQYMVFGTHPVGRRYRSIFGPNIDWHTDGFEGFIAGLH